MIHLLKRQLLKRAVYGSLRMSGALRLARHVNRGKALILTYHGVLREGSPSYLNRLCLDARVFEEQMRWLKKRYEVLPLSLLVQGLCGEASLPPFSVAVTFDDGFRNNFSAAFPILRELRIPAAVFLTTGYMGGNGYLWTDQVDSLIFASPLPRLDLRMNGHSLHYDVSTPSGKEKASNHIRAYLKTLCPSEREARIGALKVHLGAGDGQGEEAEERYAFLTWEQVRVMARSGIEFGSHTHSHAMLSTLSQEELERELLQSKAAIESELQRPCDLFSYPNGTRQDFGIRDQDALRRLGFRTALTQVAGFNSPGDDLYALKRINIARSNDLSYFKAMLAGVVGLIKK